VPMSENLGYAGAINFCVNRLLLESGWHAIWILNPDTEPTPSALAELADYSAKFNKGMVGSMIVSVGSQANTSCCGLKWSKLAARTAAVSDQKLATAFQDEIEVAEKLDAPSGASLYVTRTLVERIGLMDERYFLYFEDLEWGYRAKQLSALGYARKSIVPHKGGTTIGSAASRSASSKLSVYLEFRNRILFVRDKHNGWLPWTVVMQSLHLVAYVMSASPGNLLAAANGLAAGLRGDVGRPDRILNAFVDHHEQVRS